MKKTLIILFVALLLPLSTFAYTDIEKQNILETGEEVVAALDYMNPQGSLITNGREAKNRLRNATEAMVYLNVGWRQMYPDEDLRIEGNELRAFRDRWTSWWDEYITELSPSEGVNFMRARATTTIEAIEPTQTGKDKTTEELKAQIAELVKVVAMLTELLNERLSQ